MPALFCLALALQVCFVAGFDLLRRNNTGFVTVKSGEFQLGGLPYRFYGTNAYWLPMTTDEDMDITFHDIATAGYSVVRVWAFNDVATKPASGTYFQILGNTNPTINTGVDGLQRLDRVVSTASRYGIKLVFTLTNNWNPDRPEPSNSFSRRDNDALPRGYLSNDYGGMDRYVAAFSPSQKTHDQFYTNPAIISAFKNYVKAVVTRYSSNPTVLGWELGNDLRCASTLPASSSCNTNTITKWVVDISSYIKTLDSNHPITAGDGGYYCIGCKKLYSKKSQFKPGEFTGPTFDGSYGVDTEDIISTPCVDFGSFQLFPDQVTYFPDSRGDAANTAIAHGSDWVTLHSATATLYGRPEALTAFAIVTKDNFPFFIPFSGSTRMPADAPCGGVDDFQQNYAFVSWAKLSLSGNIAGALEYQWQQAGLTSHGTKYKRALPTSPQDGSAHYTNPYTGQTVQQFLNA